MTHLNSTFLECFYPFLQLAWSHMHAPKSNRVELTRISVAWILSQHVGNLSFLRHLNLGNNSFHGKIPQELGRLLQLQYLYLTNNSFTGEIPTNLTSCSNLKDLFLDGNNLIGKIPIGIGSLWKLQSLTVGKNNLTGGFPPFIGNLSSLIRVSVAYNNLEGDIPQQICRLKNLTVIVVEVNKLSGTFPSCLYNMSSLIVISVADNYFDGTLQPNMFHTLPNLQFFQLVGINSQRFLINKLIGLVTNSLSGTLPGEVGRLTNINWLDLSENLLSGNIPGTIGQCMRLEYLYLQGNSFHGIMPSSLASLKGLQRVDLSRNSLSGSIPKGFQNISFLEYLNVSYNMLNGEVPTEGVFQNASKLGVAGNNKLCGGIPELHLPPCPVKGSFGSVYKGNLMSEDDVVAVKVLNLQRKGAHKSFITECNALKNIRHRNLVKILTCCSSTDYKGQEFKALVFEYMKNGSLEQWLHPRTAGEEHPRTLDLDQRLNIIMDVASALHYLHLECEQLVLHCDLKPSNVLLDDGMVAHVSDFGIATLVSTIDGTSHKQTSTTGIKGTVGYAPPEYGVGSEVSTHGDMYSFGILVLEMLTGRTPTDEVFEDGQNLHKIGLACSVESPRERMNIVDVIRELNKIRNAFLNGVHTSE
ncbi:Serine/threonine-protein kinase, active site [Sesbania bispinosa]|nr:Serine/threonine-protein kinase, active site [Sesbania bispinosa]